MPQVPPADKPRGKIARFFSALAAGPKRLLNLSLAAKAALLLAAFLIALVFTAWLVFLLDPNSVSWRHTLSFGRVLTVICLVALIPLVVYRGLQLWLVGETSQYSDIDYAWKAGLEALRRNGLSLDSIPLFLFVGSSGPRHEQAVLDAAGLDLRVRDVPPGPAPIHWYANPEGIYLFCTEASWLSALATLAEKQMAAGLPIPSGGAESPAAGEFVAAPSVPQPTAPATPTPRSSDSNRGTMMLDAYQQAVLQPPPPGSRSGGFDPRSTMSVEAMPAGSFGGAMAGGGATDPAAQRGTMMLDSSMLNMIRAAPAESGVLPTPLPETKTIGLAPQDSTEQLDRLSYVCHMLRRARHPLCPINGVVTLLPFDLVQAGTRETEELGRAVKADLTAIQRALQLRCPVVALICGMEKERGFRELIRRVGKERAAGQRFGRGFDVRSLATPTELEALCAHVCGAFEDWVYTMFRERDALTRPGNTRLYGLLCKVRCHLKARLSDILSAGFGYDPARAAGDDPVMFSGCYFAATGETEERQAFVRGVFDKLAEEQEDVEWTEKAMASDRRYLWAAYGGFIVDATLVLALGGRIVYDLIMR